ncbi:type II toxin-antitoxin system death-on-curing family toxin [Nocardiopsis coralliicola]
MALHQSGQSSAVVRDYGLLESAAQRPGSVSFGVEHYPGLVEIAAALMRSLARNRVGIEESKRAAGNCSATFVDANGAPLVEPIDEDRAEGFVLDTAAGKLEEIAGIAAELRTFHSSR